ncbi:unnamed protein product [Cladocopium goreaui]|uniref:Uncharacterized protein n=1 Tax=Cladocopium goreaui TaxID=2562237 RepID=A0A9P1DM59_9DINO|nr:unnamed protein product [Cladocopium goreaui]
MAGQRKAGQRLERTEPAPARPVEEEYIKDFINSPQRKALSTPSFLVVSGSQGIGKSTMLNNLMCEHVKNGKRVLALDISVRPGETCSAVVVYLQLTTKSRRDKFSRDACDDIASTLGAFARNITYDNAYQASFNTKASLAQIAGSSFQAVMHEHSPQGLFRKEQRKAGQRLERTEPAPARPVEEEYIKDFINSPQRKALSTPSFLVVSGSQGIGKSTMLNNLMCEHVKNGKRVLPLKMSSRPGEDLKLNEALPKALQAVNLPRYYPEQVEYMLEKVNETCKRRTGSAVVVYLQLTTKSRGDKFSRDACDDIASTHGAFARNITYDNAACKFILEEVAKQGNDFRTLNKVLAEDDMDEVLKHYYIRAGGNLRALDLILEDVSREGQKGADAVIEQVEQWYNRRVEPIEKKLDDQEVKNYLLKVAEAGPMGYLPNSKQTTQMTLNLLREEPADCVLRSTTNLRVALKHWHFVAKLFEEDEQKLRDAGYRKKNKKKEKKKKKDKKKEKKEKKDPYSKTAQEKARLEAQQRLMGIDTNKKPKKKTKKKKSSSESESEQVRKMQDRLEDKTMQREMELAEEAEKAAEPIPEKSWEEMTWAERGDQAAQQAESDAIWKGASKAEAKTLGSRAREKVMLQAVEAWPS